MASSAAPPATEEAVRGYSRLAPAAAAVICVVVLLGRSGELGKDGHAVGTVRGRKGGLADRVAAHAARRTRLVGELALQAEYELDAAAASAPPSALRVRGGEGGRGGPQAGVPSAAPATTAAPAPPPAADQIRLSRPNFASTPRLGQPLKWSSADAAQRCLANRTILLTGNSVLRHWLFALGLLLQGQNEIHMQDVRGGWSSSDGALNLNATRQEEKTVCGTLPSSGVAAPRGARAPSCLLGPLLTVLRPPPPRNPPTHRWGP